MREGEREKEEREKERWRVREKEKERGKWIDFKVRTDKPSNHICPLDPSSLPSVEHSKYNVVTGYVKIMHDKGTIKIYEY